MNKVFSKFVFCFCTLSLFLNAPIYANENNGSANNFPGSFADLSEKLLPAVVNISTSKTVTARRRAMPGFPPGSPFEDFFEEFFGQGMPNNNRGGRTRKRTSLGSGFIIDPEGFVVTNNHVIDDADEVKVTLHDDQVFTAKIIGRDEKTDLALLKISDDKPFPYVPWGNSDKMRVGDWVLAIGNPFGLGGTVTSGIVSARARVLGSGPYDDFIQTDASINRGNSGGPMFNLQGEVVGINTAIVSPSGGSVGIGFAIPSMLASSVIDQLKKFGETQRGWLGVHIQEVTEEIAESLGLADKKGALVVTVSEDGPAKAAKILPGDVILAFNNKSIDEMRQLPRIVAETKIGSKVPVRVWRDGKSVTLYVKVGELQENGGDVVSSRAQGDKQATIKSLGLTLGNMTKEIQEKYQLPEGIQGVIIHDVMPESAAENKGLTAGDIILEIYQRPVESVAQAVSRIQKHKKAGKKFVLLLVKRNNVTRFVALRFMDE